MFKKKLTPKEIRTKEFGKKLFGYNPDEVEAFLNDVANAYQSLLNEIENLKRNTPEYKIEEIVEKAKKKVATIVKEKQKEKEELEKKKRELEVEIEKLALIQKKIHGKLKMALIEITKIIEELKPDAKGKEERRRSRDRGESPTESLGEQNRESGRGETEGKGNSPAGEREGKSGSS